MLSELFNTSQNWSYHLIKCLWYAWNVVLEAVLFAFNSVSVSQKSSITAARKHWWNQNCILTAEWGENWERTTNHHEWATSLLFCGCSLQSHRSLHWHLSPSQKELQCNVNNTSRNSILERRGKHHCKSDTKVGKKWKISTWQNCDSIKTKYVEPLCS